MPRDNRLRELPTPGTQPVPRVTAADVERIIAREFPAASATGIRKILDRYGGESWHRERDRVRLAALKLAGRDLKRLRTAVEQAALDYRDVLAAAEYPGYLSCPKPADDKRRQQLIDADWQQYRAWLTAPSRGRAHQTAASCRDPSDRHRPGGERGGQDQ